MKIFIVLLVTLVICGAGIYYFHFYETPEDCFVENMKAWGEKENLLSNMPGLIQEDEKMAVSRAKSITEAYGVEGMATEENRKIYLQVKAVFDYCGVK